MTVHELIEELKKQDPNATVMATERSYEHEVTSVTLDDEHPATVWLQLDE